MSSKEIVKLLLLAYAIINRIFQSSQSRARNNSPTIRSDCDWSWIEIKLSPLLTYLHVCWQNEVKDSAWQVIFWSNSIHLIETCLVQTNKYSKSKKNTFMFSETRNSSLNSFCICKVIRSLQLHVSMVFNWKLMALHRIQTIIFFVLQNLLTSVDYFCIL